MNGVAGSTVKFDTTPRIGDHVMFVNGRPSDSSAKIMHALVHLVFSDLSERPALTLVTVLSGERGVCYRSQVPHRTRWVDEKGFYLLPTELWP